jgi:type II secretory pathway pseudopilin PulG
MGILATAAIPIFANQGESSRISVHKQNLSVLKKAVDLYVVERGAYSNTQFGLVDSGTQGDAAAIMNLQNLYNAKYQELHMLTGVNEQATGAAPPSRTASSVYENTMQSSQVVTNNIFNGLLSIQQRSAESIISRLQSAALFGEMSPIIEAILGEYTTDMIAEFARLHKYQFVTNVDLKPTAEDRNRLIQDLSIALQTGTIDLTDKIDIEMIDNPKLALNMIKLRQRDKIKKAEEQAAIEHKRVIEQINAKAQGDMQSMQAKAQIETEAKMAIMNAEGQLEAFKAENKMKEISLTKQWELRIVQEQSGGVPQKVVYQEDRKDNRVDLATERQSALIDQRQNKKPPQQFLEQGNNGIPKLPTIEEYQQQPIQ